MDNLHPENETWKCHEIGLWGAEMLQTHLKDIDQRLIT